MLSEKEIVFEVCLENFFFFPHWIKCFRPELQYAHPKYETHIQP